MVMAVPSLDTAGWVEDVGEKAERLLAYFLTSDYSQSNTHAGLIQSLPYIIQSYIGNFLFLRGEIDRALNTLYSAWFDGCSITVTIDPVIVGGVESESEYSIKLDVTVMEDGVRHSLGRLLSVNNKVINQITSL